MVRVVLNRHTGTTVTLKPEQGIQIENTKKYVFDPDYIIEYEELARDWANKTDGTVDGVEYSSKAYAIGGTGTATNNSKYYSEQAATSATNASTSETNAGISATTASTQAGIATNKANDASASATTATTQAGIAIAKAGEASTSATNAGISETNAGNSANSASASASLAHDWATSTSIVESGQYGSRYYSIQAYNANVSAQSAMSSASTYATNSSVWAEGTDAQVQALGGTHSAKVWVESIGTVYKAAGSVAFASLPTLGAEYEGYVYNVTDDFTTTSDFVEGAGVNYPAGTNVVCIKTGGVYKWDTLGSFVDISGKQDVLTVGNGIDITSSVISVTSPTLTNTATGTNSLAILGSAIAAGAATAVGVGSDAGANGVSLGKSASSGNGGLALGTYSKANGSWATAVGNGNSNLNNTIASGSGAIALGHNAQATASNAIQIGEGANATADSLQVKTYTLLDTSTGLIPDARISSTIKVPSQSGQSGKFLTTDGTDASWTTISGALPSQTGQAGKYLTTDGTDASWATVFSRNIGEIVQSTIPLTDAGLHLLDGTLISGGGSYDAFVEYIKDLYDGGTATSLFTTEANWQTAVTTYGVCGKFVYDSVNNTVRLPKITGFTEGTIDPTVLGDLTTAGLPNITGHINQVMNRSTSPSASGALSASSAQSFKVAGGEYKTGHTSINLNASNSSSIYGNSSTVQPQSIKVLYYIVIATSVKTEIEVDIDQIATDLNGKADVDLTNVSPSSSFKQASVTWGMPDYTSRIDYDRTSTVVRTAPSKGYVLLNYFLSATGNAPFKINGSEVVKTYRATNNGYVSNSCYLFPVEAGDTFQITAEIGTSYGTYSFLPMKGV